MLLITGLLALVALSSAGGDHTKGGGHIKGVHHAALAQQAVQAASETDPGFGTRTFAESKSAGVKGGSASVLIPVPVEDASGSAAVSKKNIISAPVPYLRDPIALPVANQPAITTYKTVKTVKTVASATRPQSVKTVDRPTIVTQERIQPVAVSPSLKATGDILPGPFVPQRQAIGGAREVIVYDDGTIVDVGSVSGNAGPLSNVDLKPLIGGITGTGGPKEVIVYEDGTIEEVGGVSRASGQVAAKSGSIAGGNVATVRTAQRPATSSVRRPDLKIQKRPVVPSIQAVAPPKPKPARITPQQSSSDELVKINRELIQRQNQQGFIQTFGGKVKPDSNLRDISIALSDLGNARSIKPADVPRPKTAILKDQKPKYEKPRVIPGAVSTSKITTYGSSRTEGSRISSQQPRVSVQSSAVTGLSENIKLINQQLIQRQNQEGVLQAFGGVVNSESDLTGLPVSLEQFGGFEDPKPIAPKVEFRQPVALPKAPKVSTTANRGQTLKYTENGVSSGILGSSFTRTLPGRTAVGATQGYNNQFVLGTAQGSYGSNENIKLLNRQLIQRQNKEGVLQAFGGIVKSESDLTGLPVSLDQFGGYGANKPLTPVVQYKQPVAVTKPRTPTRVVSSNTGRDQIFRYTGARVTSGILGPSAPRITPVRGNVGTTQFQRQYVVRNDAGSVGSNDNLKLINRQLIQRQNEEGILNTFGGVAKTESELAGIAVSLSQLGDLSKPKNAPQIRKPVAIRDDKLKYTGTQVTSGQTAGSFGTRNKPIQAVFGNAAGSISSSRSGTQQVSAPKPKPSISQQFRPQSDDIITLNRNLILKQNEQGILQTFGGIAKNEADLDGVAVSLEELGDLTRFSGFGADIQQTPQAPKRPVNVVPKRPSSVASSQAIVGENQRAQGFGIRTTEAQRFAPARISPQNTITTTSDTQITATRTSSGINTSVSGGTISSASQSGLSDELININRQLIEKQNREGIRQTFGGIVKNEEDLEGGLVYVDELDAITRLVGYNAPTDQGPQTYGYSVSSGQSKANSNAASQNQDKGGRFTSVEQSRIATGILPSGFLDVADQNNGGQFQVKVEDVDEPSSLSQVQDSSNIPSIPALATQTFKQEDFQENIPIQVPNYSPPLKPYNYRTQIRTSASDSQNIQEQQKIEQVFV